MRTPTVAVCTLAALAALDLSPKLTDHADPHAAPIDPDAQDQQTLGQAAAAAPVSAIAPPERVGKPASAKSTRATQTTTGQSSNQQAKAVTKETQASLLPQGSQIADLGTHWAKPYVEALIADGIVQGFSDGQFRPDAAIEPAHFTAMVRRAINQYGAGFLVSYTDAALSSNQKMPLLTALVAATKPLPKGEDGAAPSLVPADFVDSLLPQVAEFLRSPLPPAAITRAEAARFIYQSLARAGAVPAIAPGQTTPVLVASAASLPTVDVPAAPGLIAPSPVPPSVAPPAKGVTSVAQVPAVSVPAAPAVPSVGQSSGSLPVVPVNSLPGNSSVPSVPSSIEAAAKGENPAEKLPPVTSQLGKLVTGDKAQNFLEYWTTLCKANPKNLAEALEACDQILTVKPREAAIWAIRGRLLLLADKPAEAVASFDRALALVPATSELQTNRCQALSQQGKQEDAIADCEQALKLDKFWGEVNPVIAWYTKGTALKRLGRNQEASAAYQRALALQPNNSLIWSDQCRVLSEMGQQEAAIAACDRALAVNANWDDRNPALAWNNRALALTRLERYAEAIAAYDHAVEFEPKDATLWTKQGLLFNKLGKHTQALLSHSQALKLSPNYSLALINQCSTLNHLGKYEEALAACDQAMSGDGRWNELGIAYAWDQRGTALAGLGKLEEALAAADRAVTMRADYAEAWSNRAVILWRMDEYKDALASVERAVAVKPDYSQGWFNKGRILRSMERYEAAIAAYDQALRGDVSPQDKPTLADIWSNRSAVLWRLDKYQEALESATKAVQIDTRSALAWYNRGSALMALQKPRDAALAYAQATRLDPTAGYAWTGRGVALEQTGRYREALAALDEALKVDPSQALAQQTREFVLKKVNLKTES